MERGKKGKGKAEVEAGKNISDAIRRVRDGDKSLYKVIFDLTDRSLRSYIAKRCRTTDPLQLDEIALRTHEYSLGRLRHYDETKSSFQTWLNRNSLSVTAVVFREWYGGRLVSLNETEHEARAPTVPGPEILRDRDERDRAVREETDALPEPGRTIIRMYDLEEHKLRVIAVRLNMTIVAVWRHRQRALALVRKRLAERGIRPVEIAPSAEPVWPRLRRKREDDDDSASVSAVLPYGPGVLVGGEPWSNEEGSD